MCGAMAALVVVRDVADAELEGLDVGVNGSGTGVSADAPPTGVGPLDRRVIAVGGIVFVVLMALTSRCWRRCWPGYRWNCLACRCPGCGCGRRWRPGPPWWSAG